MSAVASVLDDHRGLVEGLETDANARPGPGKMLVPDADNPGEFPGFSANFSGDGFSWMRFIVKSVPAGDFSAWLEQAQPLDPTGNILDVPQSNRQFDGSLLELNPNASAVGIASFASPLPE